MCPRSQASGLMIGSTTRSSASSSRCSTSPSVRCRASPRASRTAEVIARPYRGGSMGIGRTVGRGTVRSMAAGDAEVLELDGREVRLTSPGKVLFGERGETKRDLVGYYASVGAALMRTMGGRPVLMQRFPNGAEGPSFFQKARARQRAGVAADHD